MLTRLLAATFPLRCPGCGQPGAPVCDRCAATLRAAPSTSPPSGVDAWFAPLAYAGAAREVVARAKYRGLHGVNAWLAEQMAVLVGPPLPMCVTWVPTTAVRRRARGFDHAELLARRVAHTLARPASRLLKRAPGAPQTGLAAADRRIGPSITATRRPPEHVLVVDDVATTGASLAAAAAALRAAGAVRVDALTAARTPSPQHQGR